jgi:mannose-6-phosphate isomerase-like protein (cupin superfamily)
VYPINLKKEAAKVVELNKYTIISTMNDYNLTLIKTEKRKLDFHSHENTDEVFFIVEGRMKLEFKDKIVELQEGDICVVPKGVAHRPICDTTVTCLLIEPKGTLNPGNTGGAYK